MYVCALIAEVTITVTFSRLKDLETFFYTYLSMYCLGFVFLLRISLSIFCDEFYDLLLNISDIIIFVFKSFSHQD